MCNNMKKDFLDNLDAAFFDEDLMEFPNDDDFEPVIEFRPRKPKIKYKFFIAS